mmetsp:Transcript_19002/g.48629  ORF Transcript_19002/g.48629 Transcript_19002/m.48629 type:complete len:226 (-) Transcript_19002:1217-1894(-)
MPVEPMTATESWVLERARAACAARSALVQSSFSTTIEICRSDEPCAIVRMLMPELAIALVNVAPVPGRKAMPSPTMATTEWPGSAVMPPMRPLLSSRSKACCSTESARSATPSSTTMQIDESADACVTITSCTLAFASEVKRRPARSGTAEVPVPSTLRMHTLSTDVIPRIGDSFPSSDTGHAALRDCSRAVVASILNAAAASSSAHARPSMTVPGCVGLNTLRT